MGEYKGVITFKGNPLTLVGHDVKVGDIAPSFTVVDNDLGDVDLASLRGKVVIISAVPSIDTPVCDMQTRKFNEEAGKLGDDIVVLTVSMDLPFAQKRWCGAAGVESVQTVSDYKYRYFGDAYGLYIKELGLLARAVIVVDTEGHISYKQIVPEVTEEPDYATALEAARVLV